MNSYKDSTIEMIEMTLELLKKNYNDSETYIEKHKDGMLVLDTVKNRLTIYTLK